MMQLLLATSWLVINLGEGEVKQREMIHPPLSPRAQCLGIGGVAIVYLVGKGREDGKSTFS